MGVPWVFLMLPLGGAEDFSVRVRADLGPQAEEAQEEERACEAGL